MAELGAGGRGTETPSYFEVTLVQSEESMSADSIQLIAHNMNFYVIYSLIIHSLKRAAQLYPNQSNYTFGLDDSVPLHTSSVSNLIEWQASKIPCRSIGETWLQAWLQVAVILLYILMF